MPCDCALFFVDNSDFCRELMAIHLRALARSREASYVRGTIKNFLIVQPAQNPPLWPLDAPLLSAGTYSRRYPQLASGRYQSPPFMHIPNGDLTVAMHSSAKAVSSRLTFAPARGMGAKFMCLSALLQPRVSFDLKPAAALGRAITSKNNEQDRSTQEHPPIYR